MWYRQCDNLPKIAKSLLPRFIPIDIAISVSNGNGNWSKTMVVNIVLFTFYHLISVVVYQCLIHLSKTEDTFQNRWHSWWATAHAEPTVTSSSRSELQYLVFWFVPVICISIAVTGEKKRERKLQKVRATWLGITPNKITWMCFWTQLHVNKYKTVTVNIYFPWSSNSFMPF